MVILSFLEYTGELHIIVLIEGGMALYIHRRKGID
jgi:hypothetical protein